MAEFPPSKLRYFNAEDERKLDAHFEAARQEAPGEVTAIQQALAEAAATRPHRHSFHFWDYYLNPNSYFMGDYSHYPNYLFLVLPLFFILSRPKWLTWLFILSTGFYLFIASTSWLARLMLPIYPPLTLISAYTLVELSNQIPSPVQLRSRLPIYALAVGLAVPVMVSALTIVAMKTTSFLAGSRSRSEFLSTVFYYPPIHFINQSLPSDARIISMGAQMCYHMQRQYLSDEGWDSTEWRRILAANPSLEEVNNDLKRQGITHLLFSTRFFPFVARMGRQGSGGVEYMTTHGVSTDADELGPDYISLRNWATFDLYRRNFLQRIYADQYGYEIYKVK